MSKTNIDLVVSLDKKLEDARFIIKQLIQQETNAKFKREWQKTHDQLYHWVYGNNENNAD